MAESSDVFLLQKVEFLECELQECKIRETNLKKLNESLMSLVNRTDRTPLKEEAIEELKRVNEQFSCEIKELKRRSNAQQDALMVQISELKKRNKELEFALKECEVVKEREKLQFKEKVREVEADKCSLQQNLQRLEEEYLNNESQLKAELEMRMAELHEELRRSKDSMTVDQQQLRDSLEARYQSLQCSTDKERSSLLSQISSLQSQLQSKAGKAKRYKELLRSQEEATEEKTPKKYEQYLANEAITQLTQENAQLRAALKRFERSASLYQVQIRQLQGDLAVRRSEESEVQELMVTLDGKNREIEDLNRKIAVTSFQDHSFLSVREERPIQASPLSTTRASDWRNCTTRSAVQGSVRKDTAVRDSQYMDLKLSLEGMHLQKEKAQIELDRLLLELKQNKLDWAVTDSQRGENEMELKREIKFLIGKLLKAKSRLSQREAAEASIRSKSALRMRMEQTGCSYRSSSPFGT